MALLNKAIELDNSLNNDIVNDWKNRLNGNAFSCTAVLFTMMFKEIKNKYSEVSKIIIPIAWQ
jgi:hypothetical protein